MFTYSKCLLCCAIVFVVTISNYQVIKANPPQLMPYHKDTSDVICDDEVYMTLVRDCKRRLQMFTKKEEEYETAAKITTNLQFHKHLSS